MTTRTKAPTWNAKTASLCRILRDRSGPLPFTLARFRAWLTCQAQNHAEPVKERLLWRCPYSGQLLGLGDIAIDHMAPLSLGGTSQLTNLQVVSAYENAAKGKIPHEQYAALKALTRTWPLEAQRDLYGRLAAKKAWHGAFQERRKLIGRNGNGK